MFRNSHFLLLCVLIFIMMATACSEFNDDVKVNEQPNIPLATSLTAANDEENNNRIISSGSKNKSPSKETDKKRGKDVPVLSAQKGQFRALLIGVNDYEKLNDLKYCEADVQGLRDQLIAMGFNRKDIKCLTTGDRDAANRPSYRNITERLDAMFKGLDKDATVVIALSGHGGSFEWKNAEGKLKKDSFYCPQDTRLTDPLHTMISTQNIYDRLEKSPARFKLLLVDACRSKHFVPAEGRAAVNEAEIMKSFSKTLADRKLPKATLAMISCTSGEQSYEDSQLKHGVFMYYVLRGLAGEADRTYRGNRNKIVSYRELQDYVRRGTTDYVWQKFSQNQTPHFHAKWEQENFDLVKVNIPDHYIVSIDENSTLKMWDLATGKLRNTLKPKSIFSTSPFGGVATSLDGQSFVSSGSLHVLIGDLVKGKIQRRLEGSLAITKVKKGHSGSVNDVVISSDNRYIVSAGYDGCIVWSNTGKLLRSIANSAISGVAISPNSRLIVSAHSDKTLKVWNLSTGKLQRTLTGHTDDVVGVAISPDGRSIVSASCDKTLKVWDLTTGKLQRTLAGHSNAVLDVAISSNNRSIVSASRDGTLKVWDLATGRLQRTLKGHGSNVNGVAISPDNRLIVSASMDTTLKVWELATGKLLHTLKGHTSGVNAVAISPAIR